MTLQPTPELCRLYHGVDCRACVEGFAPLDKLVAIEQHWNADQWRRELEERQRRGLAVMRAHVRSLSCRKAVFVDDGFPFGECQRRHGHPGLCDVYDGRDDHERARRPWTPADGVLDFNGDRVP